MKRIQPMPGYRWRRLEPRQEAAIEKAWSDGVAASDLASEYGVHKRTIWRTVDRARRERFTDVCLGEWRATFAISDEDCPVQVTPWRAES
jgi:hypothetical protein